MRKKAFLILFGLNLLCSGAALLPISAYAQTAPGGTTPTQNTSSITLDNPLGPEANDPRKLIARLIQAMIALSGAIALVMFIYAGLLFLTAGGASDPIRKAKLLMLYTVLGIVVIAGAFVATNTIFTAVLSEEGSPVVGQ